MGYKNDVSEKSKSNQSVFGKIQVLDLVVSKRICNFVAGTKNK